MSSRIKRYFAVLLVAFSLLATQMACDDSAPRTSQPKTTVISTNSGSEWRRCASLTCTFKKNGNVKSAIKGARINVGTAVPLGGKWE